MLRRIRSVCLELAVGFGTLPIATVSAQEGGFESAMTLYLGGNERGPRL